MKGNPRSRATIDLTKLSRDRAERVLGPNLKGGVQIDLLNDYPSKQSNLIHLEYSFRSHLIQESLSVD